MTAPSASRTTPNAMFEASRQTFHRLDGGALHTPATGSSFITRFCRSCHNSSNSFGNGSSHVTAIDVASLFIQNEAIHTLGNGQSFCHTSEICCALLLVPPVSNHTHDDDTASCGCCQLSTSNQARANWAKPPLASLAARVRSKLMRQPPPDHQE